MIDHWCDLDASALGERIGSWGFPRSHAPRVLRHFYRCGGRLDGIDAVVGPRLARLLREVLRPVESTVEARQRSRDGTEKLLIRLAAGGAVEAVLMPSYRPGRAAACVSSQVGCAMGCGFCASTRGGLERDLSAHEIVEQFLHLSRVAAEANRRITSLVFMGMGEPMHNLDAVLAAVPKIAHPDLGGVGWRQVTISTVGIVPGIDRLTEANLNVHLALSLHAADDQTRSRLVPMNRRYPIEQILSAARRFHDRTGRIVTIEWCLIEGVNDSPVQAALLASLLHRHGLRAHANVIPFNPIGTGVFARPGEAKVDAFLAALRERGVVAHRRDTRGDDVSAACGQLRRTSMKPQAVA